MTALSTEQRVLGDDGLTEVLPALLALATALTGSPEDGADLVAATLARRPALVRSALSADFPEPRLRALVAQQYLARRTKPIGDGLAGMAPRQRAAVVLRDGYQLTALEIAAALDRPVSAIIADLAAEPDSCAGEVAALTAVSPPPETLVGRLERATRSNRRLRARLVSVIAAVAILVAALVAVPTVILPRLPGPVRSPGSWQFSHQIRPAAGWVVVQRSITKNLETSEIKPPVQPNDPYSCWVNVYTAGTFKPGDQRVTEQTTVHGRPAILGVGQDNDTFLAWEYGNDAWARAYCSTVNGDASVLRSVADMITFKSDPVRLPFTVAAWPANYTPSIISEYPESHLVEVQLTRPDIKPGDVNLVISAPLDRFGTQGDPTTVNGRVWRYAGGNEPRMCTVDSGRVTLCISGYWPGGDWPAPAPYPQNAPQQLRSLADQITPAADLGDPDSWSTGGQLPRA